MNQATGSPYVDGSARADRTSIRASLITEYAAGSAVLAAVLTAIGTFKESNGSAGEYLVVVAIIAAATAVVFGLVAPPSLRDEEKGNTPAVAALILGVVGVVSIAVFWTGLPVVFAGGAALLGLEGRRRAGDAGNGPVAVSALVLSCATMALAITAAVIG